MRSMSPQDGDHNTIVCKQKQFPSSLLFGELWIYEKTLLQFSRIYYCHICYFFLLKDHLFDQLKGQSPFLSISILVMTYLSKATWNNTKKDLSQGLESCIHQELRVPKLSFCETWPTKWPSVVIVQADIFMSRSWWVLFFWPLDPLSCHLQSTYCLIPITQKITFLIAKN